MFHTATARAARDHEAQANIAEHIGDNIAPQQGDEAAFDTLSRMETFLNKSDANLIQEFAHAYGVTDAAAIEHPLDYLLKEVEFADADHLDAIASRHPALNSFTRENLLIRRQPLKAAQGIFTARKLNYERPTNIEKGMRVGGACAFDMLGGSGIGIATTVGTSLAIKALASASFATDVVAAAVTLRPAMDFAKMSRAKALTELHEMALTQLKESPVIMKRASHELYSRENLSRLDQIALREHSQHLYHASNAVNNSLEEYLNSLAQIDRDMGESAESALHRKGGQGHSRSLFANVLREQRILKEIIAQAD